MGLRQRHIKVQSKARDPLTTNTLMEIVIKISQVSLRHQLNMESMPHKRIELNLVHSNNDMIDFYLLKVNT
jgi:hypothetical protein